MEFESLASQPRVAGLPEVNCRHSTFRGRHNAVLEADPRELNTCTPSTVQVYTCSMPLEWFSMVYTDSGRLLPLTAIGAGIDFIHIFRTVHLPRFAASLGLMSAWRADGQTHQSGHPARAARMASRHSVALRILFESMARSVRASGLCRVLRRLVTVQQIDRDLTKCGDLTEDRLVLRVFRDTLDSTVWTATWFALRWAPTGGAPMWDPNHYRECASAGCRSDRPFEVPDEEIRAAALKERL